MIYCEFVRNLLGRRRAGTLVARKEWGALRRHEDWWRQALRDWQHARHALGDEDYEWAAFAAHQAAEKAVKALLQARGIDAWGHSITFLLGSLGEPDRVEPALLDAVKDLDRHYIAPRYPDAFPEGAPADYYTKATAEQALAVAERVLAFVADKLQKSP
ncbi:MAG TPA: HEPN domain-containing protein [Bacillota bacterium]